jgi:hypothetical protein
MVSQNSPVGLVSVRRAETYNDGLTPAREREIAARLVPVLLPAGRVLVVYGEVQLYSRISHGPEVTGLDHEAVGDVRSVFSGRPRSLRRDRR